MVKVKRSLSVGILVLVCIASACSPSAGTETIAPTEVGAATGISQIPVFPGAVEEQVPDVRYYRVENTEVSTVVAYYKDVMKEQGWELVSQSDVSTLSTGKALALTFVKDGMEVGMSVFADGEATKFGILFTEE